mmetsp:Transcript_14037/g.34623  ORF Transcript_14037/g.34623 Transcript_14037/m.34623 type:complete len:211 (-) Transcript_14037:125-757(-)
MMSAHSASRATRMFWKEPRMWMRWSAITSRVRVAFSIVNLVLPLLPASRPMQRAMCSPRSVLTSLTSKHSTYRSSRRSSAMASRTSNPSRKACTKSAAFWSTSELGVCGVVLISTFFVFRFMRMSSLRLSVMGEYSSIQCVLSGVMRCWGTGTLLNSTFCPPSCADTGANAGFAGKLSAPSNPASVSMAIGTSCRGTLSSFLDTFGMFAN